MSAHLTIVEYVSIESRNSLYKMLRTFVFKYYMFVLCLYSIKNKPYTLIQVLSSLFYSHVSQVYFNIVVVARFGSCTLNKVD